MTRRGFLYSVAAYGRTPSVEELVIDASTRRTLHNSFTAGRKEPVGSLVKVFTALAYGTRHGNEFPVVTCHGCWRAKGHGAVTLAAAIGQSCNAYFLHLARAVSHEDVALLAATYRLSPPLIDAPEARIGLGPAGWLESPENIARAYLTLAERRHEPGAGAIVEGLRQAARVGTAKACGAGVLAKTGTAACVHHPAMPGDGWALGLFPEDAPRYAVVVREHGVPGATAAVRLAARVKA